MVQRRFGTGNFFAMGELAAGERVVDVGSGGGIDSLIAARMVGPTGEVVGIDMTPAMLEKARAAAAESGIANVEFREAYMEDLPVPDGWADVVISNVASRRRIWTTCCVRCASLPKRWHHTSPTRDSDTVVLTGMTNDLDASLYLAHGAPHGGDGCGPLVGRF